MTISPLPYTCLPTKHTGDRQGQVRLSSHTLITLRAAEILGVQNPNSKFYLTGECTGGPYNRSTDQLERDYLIKRGIKEDRIPREQVVGNLNNTGAQIEELRDHASGPLTIVCLDFHKDRVVELMSQKSLFCKIITAEEIILKAYPSLSAEKLHRIIGSKETILGTGKVYAVEEVMRLGTVMGRTGLLALNILRKSTGQDGPTITDKDVLGSAKKLWPQSYAATLPPH